ncbi:uncharacterized protein BO96DRAFT_180075 [Aspergillus niger CBS 101883]|uniref:uncharacterized protein n=1 Tax=Aspergillus lacticoffeatus (strain CBS 101883) TaxID=1450533 RepID=UPI000D7FFE29|nr:uncharacterized protein BO96DRAFT_180075 [Aspergillus niger CBS 101883]PYH60010.1 hypothetical protein BO96DRAFT_180075 [Aspergillus niger CBS 101883]
MSLPWAVSFPFGGTSHLMPLSFSLQGQTVAMCRSCCMSLRHAIFLHTQHLTPTRTIFRTWFKLESTKYREGIHG